MADHGDWQLELKHMFSISNIDDLKFVLDIFTDKQDIGINLFFKSIYMTRDML